MSAGAGPGATVTRETVLVLCRANMARSPLAAALLRDALDRIGRSDIRVVSAGFDVPSAEAVSDEALQVGRGRGLDLSRHRSRRVSADEVADAALILTMTEAERARAARLAPLAISRTFSLPELSRLLRTSDRRARTARDIATRAHRARPVTPPADAPEDVADPLGRGVRHYQGMADRLTGMIADLTGHLTEGASRPTR